MNKGTRKILPGEIPTHQTPPLENSPPGKLPPRKFPPGIFPPIFSNILFFPLLLPLSLILVKRLYFCLLKMLKLDLM